MMLNNRLMIAEIYDSMALKKVQNQKKTSVREAISQSLAFSKRAELYRDIDRLDAPIGSRTR